EDRGAVQIKGGVGIDDRPAIGDHPTTQSLANRHSPLGQHICVQPGTMLRNELAQSTVEIKDAVGGRHDPTKRSVYPDTQLIRSDRLTDQAAAFEDSPKRVV